MEIPENLILPFSGEKYVEEPVVIEKGSGAYLWDTKGKRYIDGCSSLWVTILGHNHSRINEALKRQLSMLAHATLYGQAHKPAIELTERLMEFLDLPDYRILYGLSGSDAVESAIKIIKQFWLRKEKKHIRKRIVTFTNSYHGETSAAMSVSGLSAHDDMFPGLVFEKTETASPVKTKIDEQNVNLDEKKSFDDIVAEYDKEIAGVILEPVYGAGGILFPSPSFLSKIAAVCKERGYILVIDEVASGFYRTGSRFCYQEYGIKPDILILGKALSGGYLPISATVISPWIGEPFERNNNKLPLMHGHTFAGNPLSCSTAIEAINIFESAEFNEKLTGIVSYFNNRIESILHEDVAEIRHKGLFAGIELFNKKKSCDWLNIALQVCNDAKKQGLLIRPLGNVLVVAPPAIIKVTDIDTTIEIIAHSINAVCQ
jgi:adenosylmethionine---8-amino-7-oxononanoate aminotransferase